MMEIIPAVDIKDGRCVRLYKGDFEQETDYGSPLTQAKTWANKGANWLHIVDLDGALEGKPANLDIIKTIRKETDLKIEVGGGIRDLATIKQYLENGIDRVIIGTAAIENPPLIEEAIKEFGADKIVVGIDAKDGFVATEGWLETSDTSAIALGQEMKKRGVEWVVYTDIERDGTLEGVNFVSVAEMAKETGLNVIASGGVASLEDIEALVELKEDKIKGVITGKALYSENLDLEEAMEKVRE